MIYRFVPVAILIILVVASGVGTVYVKHVSRSLFVELHTLQQAEDNMQIEWGQLQLEQSTWATHDRIRTIATKKLELFQPRGNEIILVNTR